MIDPFARFLDHYYRRRPVNATFTGMHVYDSCLPDWSPEGLASLDGELRKLLPRIDEQFPGTSSPQEYRDDVDLVDAELIRAFCELEIAEYASRHGMRGNPALWTGEAIFAVISLMISAFGPLDDRLRAATERMNAIPEFLGHARTALGDGPIPAVWSARASRDCEGAAILFSGGMQRWIASGRHAPANEPLALAAETAAAAAFRDFADWLHARGVAPEADMACGSVTYDFLLARGHLSPRTSADLRPVVRERFVAECARLEDMARDVAGSWEHVQSRMAENHPVASDYLRAFERANVMCRLAVAVANVVTWPEWPLDFVEIPAWTRDAAPYLHYQGYRSPAPLDPYDEHDYFVPPLPLGDPREHLRAWNHSVIKLEHIVLTAGPGHHLQNWHAYHRSTSRVGRIAAVDGASRIGMFCGATMSKGWPGYALELVDELGILLPLERVAAQRARVRMLARAVVDLDFHTGTLTFDEGVRLFHQAAKMSDAEARAEMEECSMFPAAQVSAWLGTQGILEIRAQARERERDAFSLKRFHDELLHYGSIPVPLIARLMLLDPG